MESRSGSARDATNGDAANKIGIYGLAIAAKRHRVPFYIAAPLSTFDEDCACGGGIPIEERDGNEVRYIGGVFVIPEDIREWNPAFDVTPNELIEGIITERGIIRAPYAENIEKIFLGGKDRDEK